MNKNLLWALLSAVPIAFGLVDGVISTSARYGMHRISFEEKPEMFLLYMAVFSGLVLFFLYRAITRSG